VVCFFVQIVYNKQGIDNERVLTVKKFLNISAYLVFGVLTTAINLGAYKVLLGLGVDYRLSAFLAFVLAVLFAFVTNRKYVFSGTGKVWQECILFFGMRGLTFLVNLAGLIMMVQYLGWDEFWSQLVLNGLIIILNYVLSKYVVFNLKSIKEYVERAVS
jgi:putative flippase GtrA